MLEESVKLKEMLDGAYDEVDDAEAVNRRFWVGYRLIVWCIQRHSLLHLIRQTIGSVVLKQTNEGSWMGKVGTPHGPHYGW